MYYVYVLRSKTNIKKFYIGYTTDVEKRLIAHNKGENISTASEQWEIVYYEAYKSKEYAMHREKKLKNNRRSKQMLLKRIKESLE